MFMVRVFKDGNPIERRMSTDFRYVTWFVDLREQEGCECTVYEEKEESWEKINI